MAIFKLGYGTVPGQYKSAGAIRYDIIHFDSVNYNKIYTLVLYSTKLPYPKDADNTTFTIASGGTGTGTVSYSRSAGKIYYFFSDDTIITGQSIILTFATDIFYQAGGTTTSGSVTIIRTGMKQPYSSVGSSGPPDIDHPAFIAYDWGYWSMNLHNVYAGVNQGESVTYDAVVDKVEIGSPYPCQVGTRVLYGGTLRKDPIGLQLISANQINLPATALLEINGTQYTITDGNYVDIGVAGQSYGKVGVFDIGLSGACIDIFLSGQPVPPPTPTGGTIPTLPPFPSDPGCTLPALSWNFIDVMKGLIVWVVCHINHIITILGWFKDVIVSSFDYVMQFILYFLSLKWLTDFIAKFFDALDTWLSAKFGIEKEKPFLDELLKKFMSWLLSFLDSAAENEKKSR